MKKVKLFISLASFCLALAVLSFGVYAAASITYTVSGSVSYTVSDVYAKVEARDFKAAAVKTAVADFASTTAATTSAPSGYEWVSSKKSADNITATGSLAAFTAFALTSSIKTYGIIVTITNLAANTMTVTLPTAPSGTNVTINKTASVNTITRNQSVSYIVMINVTDAKLSASCSLSLEFGLAASNPS